MDKGDEQESTNKKTRDLPNLSECQACGFRNDSCTVTNKIQLLYSEWRIVLLCSKCFNRIESSLVCSYCFKETTEDFLTCSLCKRSVHKNCFLKCKTVASINLHVEALICVDCWVPKCLVKRRKNCTNSADFGNSNSRVSNGDVNIAVERKIVFALVARGITGRESLVPRSNALDSEVKRDTGGENQKRDAVDDDAELAFQLHRTMNSSPRISKNLCMVNPGVTQVAKKWECDGALMLGGSGSGSCSNNALKSSGDETSTNFDSRSSCNRHNKSTSCKVEICNRKLDRFFFKYRKRNTSRFLLKYRRRSSSSKPVLDNKSDVEICNQKPDRYLLKYRRRDTSSKQTHDDEFKILYEKFPSPASR